MKTQKWSEVRKRRFSPEKRKKLDSKIAKDLFEMDLKSMREVLNKTQQEVAEAAQMTQSELSRIEKRTDLKLSTMRRIVASLGGELEVVANFGDKRIRLHFAS